MKTIKISHKLIGEDHPTFIIAEAGVNHNGELTQAKQLVDIALDAEVDAVKFQTFKAEGLVKKDIDTAEYIKNKIGRNISQFELIKSLELSYNDFRNLKEYCDKKKIIFLSTPHSFDAIDFLDELIPAYKFGSGDITNIPTLKYVARKNKPIILGTGMSNIEEIKTAVNAIKSEGNQDIIALHCTTNYPCSLEEVNLNAMITMKNELNCHVGYSDHTLGITVPIIATALGAVMIEKHFTIDNNLPGPDHSASLEPEELKTMVKEIRKTETILGSYNKKPTANEKNIMKLVRKSIVANQDIDKGSLIDKDMIIIKRPGTGITPGDFDKIIGKKAKRKITKDEIMQYNMVE